MKEKNQEREKTFKKVKAILQKGDSFKAIEFLNGSGDPLTIARRYSELVLDFYWKERSLSHVIPFSISGIQYCLTKAEGSRRKKVAKELKGIAKAISYNLASFTWPGWNEKGIHITPSEMKIGLDSAKFNLRLARELKKGDIPHSAAYWVLGAQYLAGGNIPHAIEAFIFSRRYARKGKNPMFEFLADGYIGVSKSLQGRTKLSGKIQLDQAIELLKRLKTEDAKFCIRQLKTALKVFSK